jgi:hypothetical protein
MNDVAERAIKRRAHANFAASVSAQPLPGLSLSRTVSKVQLNLNTIPAESLGLNWYVPK